MTPEVADTLPARLRYRLYRWRVARRGTPMPYSMYRQSLWLGRQTRRSKT